jgi:trans-aconitate 2-methyltransferase
MNQDLWNPEAYARFKAERNLPFYDLLDLLNAVPDGRVIDLGCGTGELTQQLHQRLGARSTVGIDVSSNMLEKSEAFAGNGLTFEKADIQTYESAEPFDVVFSNAAVHFVLADQRELFGRFYQMLAPGGQLAIHLPSNFNHPSQTVAAEVASESPFREALGGWVRKSPVLPPEEYAKILHELGFRKQIVRLNVYGHELPDREEVITWVRSSMLTDYQKRLAPEMFDEFLERYRRRLLPQLDSAKPSFFTFNRLLLWALK